MTAPAPAPALELVDVSFGYGGGETVLDGVTLTVAADDYLAILGPNGGGKTTLLKLILGLLQPTRGRVRVFGQTPVAARGTIGYVPQRAGFDLQFPIRVLDVVGMGRLGKRSLFARASADDRDAAMSALAQVEMAPLYDRPVGQLSGGQLQRVLIARALALAPRLLLLDEPTASLDERIGRSVWELLAELGERIAVIVVTHDIGAISEHVKSVACLDHRLYYHPTRKLTTEVIEQVVALGHRFPVAVRAHQNDRVY